MLSRTAVLWIVYAAIIGFVLGASLFAPPMPPTNNKIIDQSNPSPEHGSSQGTFVKSADEKIADYTWYVAAFTCALVVISAIQIHFLLRSDETARIAANAAKRSADAAIAIELPLIRARIGQLGYSDGMEFGKPLHQVWVDELILTNLGKTKAFPLNLEMGVTVGDSLPKIPIYTSERPFSITAMLTDNEHEIRLIGFGFEVVRTFTTSCAAAK